MKMKNEYSPVQPYTMENLPDQDALIWIAFGSGKALHSRYDGKHEVHVRQLQDGCVFPRVWHSMLCVGPETDPGYHEALKKAGELAAQRSFAGKRRACEHLDAVLSGLDKISAYSAQLREQSGDDNTGLMELTSYKIDEIVRDLQYQIRVAQDNLKLF